MTDRHAAPAFGGGDDFLDEICLMETDADALETKTAAPRRGDPRTAADPQREAIVAIGREVMDIGRKVEEIKAAQSRRPAASRSDPTRSRSDAPPRNPLRPDREAGDPTDLRSAFDRKRRAWEVYQDLLGRSDRERKRGGVDPVTRDALARLDRILDRSADHERSFTLRKRIDAIIAERLSAAEVKRDRPPGLASRWGGGGAPARQKAMREHHKAAVLHYLRTGQETYKGETLIDIQRKAMHTELNPDGGYIVLSERESNPLDAFLLELSMMRQRAMVMTITTNELVRPVNQRGADAGWVAESGLRPETQSPVLSQDRFPVMELYAMPAATQTLLDDAVIDLESWIAQQVVDAFALQESPAFMTGIGGTQPRGLLSYEFVLDHTTWEHGKFRVVNSGVDGSAGGFPTFDPMSPTDPGPQDVLLDVQYSLKAAHRQNATWLANRGTIGAIRKFKDANGLPLWQPSTQMGQPASLLGHTIDEDEYMPDIGDDTIPIGLGDWKRTYLIVDRIGMRVLRDPYTSKPFILFYTTKRVGGGVQYFDAAVFLRTSDGS